MNLLTQAIEHAGGITALSRFCGVTYQAVRRWEVAGRLPRTEITGETQYATAIAKATRGKITRKQLMTLTKLGWTRAA